MAIHYKGVEIESPQSVDSEVDIMKTAIDRVPSEIIRYVSGIFCSSPEGTEFLVVVKPGIVTDELKYLVNASFNRGSGDNGIFSIQNWSLEAQPV